MSTCNQLHLQTLGSQPMIMPKNLPDHWTQQQNVRTFQQTGG